MCACARGFAAVVAVVAVVASALGSEDEALVALLVEGYSLAEAGAELGYSRRTLQRRLAHLRSALGASTNREAVIIATRR